MTNLEKAARQALNRLTAAQEWIDDAVRGGHRHHTEIESAGDLWPETVALRAALAQQAEPVVMQYIALCDAMRYSERKDELTSPEEHAESLVAEIERLKQAEPVVERINAGPVGYRYKYPDGDWRFSGGIKINGCDPIDSEPVYTHPAVKQQQAEPVAELLTVEWQACTKLPVTVHVRERRPGELHISTREGITPIEPDDLIMRGVQGEEYPISRAIFNQTYRLGEAAKQAEPVAEPAIPWGKVIGAGQKRGCPVCGLGADGKVMGYVCPRVDCPTQVRSGTHE